MFVTYIDQNHFPDIIIITIIIIVFQVRYREGSEGRMEKKEEERAHRAKHTPCVRSNGSHVKIEGFTNSNEQNVMQIQEMPFVKRKKGSSESAFAESVLRKRNTNTHCCCSCCSLSVSQWPVFCMDRESSHKGQEEDAV